MHSLQYGECTGISDFWIHDVLVLACLVPCEYFAEGVRMELYRDADMSTRSIRAHRRVCDGVYDIFEVPLMLSKTCISSSGGELAYAFSIKTAYGLLWASSDGTATSEREGAYFKRLRVSNL